MLKCAVLSSSQIQIPSTNTIPVPGRQVHIGQLHKQHFYPMGIPGLGTGDLKITSTLFLPSRSSQTHRTRTL